MALPKLNDMPKYSVTIPSLKREVRIRPFVVKEEKILLVAMESQDPKQIAHAIIDTIESCVQDDIDTQKMTSYDVEYLFTQIRGKSVGETTNIGVNCPSCEHQNEVSVNLSEIKIHGEVPNHKINLTDNVIVEMKAPTYLQVANNEKITGENQSSMDRVFALIVQSIDAVLTDEERISFKDTSYNECIEFLESMTSDQFTKIRKYIENQPSLKHDIQFKCVGCNEDQKMTLEGMQDFF